MKEEEESEQDALWRASGELIFEFPIDNLPEAISQLEQENIVQALEKYRGNTFLTYKESTPLNCVTSESENDTHLLFKLLGIKTFP